jgi:hypothetical protein
MPQQTMPQQHSCAWASHTTLVCHNGRHNGRHNGSTTDKQTHNSLSNACGSQPLSDAYSQHNLAVSNLQWLQASRATVTKQHHDIKTTYNPARPD